MSMHIKVQFAPGVVRKSDANCTWSGAEDGANYANNGANCTWSCATKVQIAAGMVQKMVQVRSQSLLDASDLVGWGGGALELCAETKN